MPNVCLFSKKVSDKKGFTLVELVIVIGIILTIFTALFGGLKFTLGLIAQSKTKLTATSLANTRMEYIRSLSYDAVGTVAGIPSGLIPQNRTVQLNNITFNERVLIEYVDDPADGLDTADTNAIAADYKKVKIEYTWNVNNATSTIFVMSNIVPRSIETTAGGGTIRVNVLDDNSQLLPGASVRLVNESGTVDVTRFTDLTGSALFSGAPADSGYQVIVTGLIAGHEYSTDRTYEATTTNPSPVRGPFALLEGDVSTQTFNIGRLSDLTVRLLSAKSEDSFVYDFLDLADVATSTSVISDGNNLTLESVAGNYVSIGEAYLNTISPVSLEEWGAIKVATNVPANTYFRIRLYQPTVPYTLIPDGDLPGNSTGFGDGLIDISALDISTYPEVVVGIELGSSDTSLTPSIDQLSVYYVESVTPLASESFSIQGDKIIGSDASSTPIYKNEFSGTTDGSGELTFSDLEYDLYEIETSSSYSVAEACSQYPLPHLAGIDSNLQLVLISPVVNSLRVKVVDAVGRPVPGVEIELTRPGYNTTHTSSLCGQALFTGISFAAPDFQLEISSPGYQTQTITDVSVDGSSDLLVTIIED